MGMTSQLRIGIIPSAAGQSWRLRFGLANIRVDYHLKKNRCFLREGTMTDPFYTTKEYEQELQKKIIRNM
jgi:hypothetical protein